MVNVVSENLYVVDAVEISDNCGFQNLQTQFLPSACLNHVRGVGFDVGTGMLVIAWEDFELMYRIAKKEREIK